MSQPCSSESSAAAGPGHVCRVLLFRRNGAELLLEKTGNGFSFPTVDIPTQERPTESINAAVCSRYGISAHCVFTPGIPNPAPLVGNRRSLYQVMETDSEAVSPREGSTWASAATVSERRFADRLDFAVLAAVRREMTRYCEGNRENAVGRPGWVHELRAWVEQQIAPFGLHLTGAVRQLNSGRSFALLRFDTNGPAVWFKAVGAPNHHERAVSITLANLFPHFVPRILAVHPGWNGWLTWEAEGALLETQSATAAWRAAARALAELQIASRANTSRLLQSGCKDARIGYLEAQIGPYSELTTELMARQTKVPPYPLDRNQLAELGERLRRLLREAEGVGIPDTLGHLDLNPGNIVITRAGCVFLDWAGASVGQPFVAFEYLRAHFRRANAIGGDEGLLAAYLQAWRELLGEETVIRARRLAPLLAVYTLAAAGMTWGNLDAMHVGTSAGYLRSLTRRMWAEAALLDQQPQPTELAGRFQC